MSERKRDVARRTWKLLRVILFWARKGGVFKRRFMVELRQLVKSLDCATPHCQLHYGEREFSFDKTPVFHVKMHRPASIRFHLPCIKPRVDYDYEIDDGAEVYGFDDGRKSFLTNEGDGDDNYDEEEDGIDLRAEKFIAKFYEQMKLQRQVSYLQYNDLVK